jgi:hypothetical protein
MLKVDLLGMRWSSHAQVFFRLLWTARLRNKPNEAQDDKRAEEFPMMKAQELSLIESSFR